MQTIYLDISNKGVVPTIYAKQGDVGRKVQVIFTDSGIPYEIPENAELSVWYDGDSGDGNYTDIGDKSAIAVENNKVTFELITQMLNNDGEGIVCLIMNVGEEQIGSWNIHYLCEKVPGFDSEGASSYFTAFSESVNKLKNVDETLTKKGYPADAKATGDKIDNLTAKDVGARPDTWTPTAAQVGAVPTSRKINGKALSANISLSADDVNAAPAGLGLGEYLAALPVITDADTTLATGWYRVSSGVTGTPFTGILLVEALDENHSKQTLYGVTNGKILYRNRISGTFSEWEYINPSLVVGTEYRTTERYKNKTVWVVLADLGTCPVGETTVNTGFSAVEVVRWSGADRLYESARNDRYILVRRASVVSGKLAITVISGTMNGSSHEYCTVWYTKE